MFLVFQQQQNEYLFCPTLSLLVSIINSSTMSHILYHKVQLLSLKGLPISPVSVQRFVALPYKPLLYTLNLLIVMKIWARNYNATLQLSKT